MADPIHYYFVIPVALLVVQVVVYTSSYSILLLALRKLKRLLSTSQSNAKCITAHEHHARAKVQHEQHVKELHRKLTMQGEDNENI